VFVVNRRDVIGDARQVAELTADLRRTLEADGIRGRPVFVVSADPPDGARSTGAPPGGSPDPSGSVVDRDWLDPDDLAELLGARLNGTGLPSVLERLARAGYLTLREGRVEAGPLLDTLDEPGAADRARALVARHQRLAHLRRRAAELDGANGGEPGDAED
jgi:hypothetical protein